MAELDKSNKMTVDCGKRTFYPAGANVYITDVDHETGLCFIAVSTRGTPWKSNVQDKNGKTLRVKRGDEMVDKLPSLVYASTKGALKLNASGQCLSLNLYIPADYGKAAKEAKESLTLDQAFGKLSK